MSRRSPSPARRARKADRRYLVEIVASGAVVGWRFAPGPHLRAAGAKTKILRRPDGAYMSWEEAKRARDVALARAEGLAVAEEAAKPPAPKRTLAALWGAYTAWQAGLAPDDDDRVAPKTLKFYAWALGAWLDWGGDEPVAALDPETILAEYQAQRKVRSHATAHASLRALMAVLAFGVRRGWIATNPALQLKRKRPKGRKRLGSPAEIEALVATADAMGKPAIGDAIVAALWTGQREGDLLACDLSRQLVDGRLVFNQGKTDAEAQAKIAPPLADRLAGRTTGLLVRRPDGSAAPWNQHTFRHAYAAVRAEAAKACPSVATLQFRDLRDTALTRMALAGVEKHGRRAVSGHSAASQDQMEQDHYLVLSAEFADQAAERLEAWRLRVGAKW